MTTELTAGLPHCIPHLAFGSDRRQIFSTQGSRINVYDIEPRFEISAFCAYASHQNSAKRPQPVPIYQVRREQYSRYLVYLGSVPCTTHVQHSTGTAFMEQCRSGQLLWSSAETMLILFIRDQLQSQSELGKAGMEGIRNSMVSLAPAC